MELFVSEEERASMSDKEIRGLILLETLFEPHKIEQRKEALSEQRKEVSKDKRRKTVKMGQHRRNARERSLPNDLSNEQQDAIMTHFNNACALTGETIDLHLDHVIPLAAGHGGTTYGNMIPLRGDLNCSKNDSNLFEWFKSNRRRFELSQERFDALVQYLADVNEMTVEEYTKYYYECFEDKAKEESA
ncbi:HNH endonuclease [Priestia megaterium]|uniref:HNH endonuclease n=1 Tax=Priestia megaterium TaxID=1404 RepID=UPI003458C996